MTAGRAERGGADVAGDLLRRLDEAERASPPLRALAASPLRRLSYWARRLASAAHPVGATARLFTGQRLRVVLPDLVARDLLRTGFIEPATTRALLELVRPGDTVLDVGAQYGYHSLLASLLVGPAGRVVAFEPSRETFPLLAGNLDGLDNARAELAAAWSGDGELALHDPGPARSALTSLFADARAPLRERRRLRARSYDVRCLALDGYCRRHGLLPTFVKLDAEGAELEILRGMGRLLTEVRPALTVETGDYGGRGHPPTRACVDHLLALGYRCYERDGGLREHRPRDAYGYGNLLFLPAERAPPERAGRDGLAGGGRDG